MEASQGKPVDSDDLHYAIQRGLDTKTLKQVLSGEYNIPQWIFEYLFMLNCISGDIDNVIALDSKILVSFQWSAMSAYADSPSILALSHLFKIGNEYMIFSKDTILRSGLNRYQVVLNKIPRDDIDSWKYHYCLGKINSSQKLK
jgi:hypothetical protein